MRFRNIHKIPEKPVFKDRRDAGQKLGQALLKYKNKDALVLAIPKGGIEIGRQVAEALDADLSVIVSRKLPRPEDPESGFGAVAEDGSVYFAPGFEGYLSSEMIDGIVSRQAYLLTYMDAFRVIGVFFLCCMPLLLLFKQGRTPIQAVRFE